MSTPNIPIDKLRAVSPEMGDLMSDIDNSHIIDVLCFMQNKKSKTLRVNSLYEDLWAIARDLLRLAEENEKMRVIIDKVVKGKDFAPLISLDAIDE